MDRKPGKIIAVVNNKGGVGKTSVSVNLGHALANKGHRVAVLDLDSQCNSTSLLVERGIIRNTVYELLSDTRTDPEFCTYPTAYDNLFCIANDEDTAALEMELLENPGVPAAYFILRNRCREHLQNRFDFTLIDCPPNLGFFVLSALYCSDFVVVPVIAGSAFSLEGLAKAAKIIGQISEGPNPDLRFLRMLVNNVDMRTHFGKTCMTQLRGQFGGEQVFETYIPASAAFQQAEAMRRTLLRHSSNANASKAYRDLAQELTTIIEAEA